MELLIKQQVHQPDLWITPIVGADLGKRNTQEFKDTVLRLYRMYNVPVRLPHLPFFLDFCFVNVK